MVPRKPKWWVALLRVFVSVSELPRADDPESWRRRWAVSVRWGRVGAAAVALLALAWVLHLVWFHQPGVDEQRFRPSSEVTWPMSDLELRQLQAMRVSALRRLRAGAAHPAALVEISPDDGGAATASAAAAGWDKGDRTRDILSMAPYYRVYQQTLWLSVDGHGEDVMEMHNPVVLYSGGPRQTIHEHSAMCYNRSEANHFVTERHRMVEVSYDDPLGVSRRDLFHDNAAFALQHAVDVFRGWWPCSPYGEDRWKFPRPVGLPD